MNRFVLQLVPRPVPWVPHMHFCPTCIEEYPCDLPGTCSGRLRCREHVTKRCGPSVIIGMDAAYMPSFNTFITRRKGKLYVSKDGINWGHKVDDYWEDPHLQRIMGERINTIFVDDVIPAPRLEPLAISHLPGDTSRKP